MNDKERECIQQPALTFPAETKVAFERAHSPIEDHQQMRLRYLTELKERNTCLVTINQKLDHFMKTDPTSIKNFAELKSAIYSKLSLIHKEWKKLTQLNPSPASQKRNDRLNAEKRVNELLEDKQLLETQLQSLQDKNAELMKDNLRLLKHEDQGEIQRLKQELQAKTKSLHDQTRRLKNAKEQYAELVSSHQKKGKMIQEALSKLSHLSHGESEDFKAYFS